MVDRIQASLAGATECQQCVRVAKGKDTRNGEDDDMLLLSGNLSALGGPSVGVHNSAGRMYFLV